MPHSGGGGSSHSGSHSSSSSSSSHHSGRERHTSPIYFPGSYVYVRYNNNRPYYRYSNFPDEDKPFSVKKTMLMFCPVLIFILLFSFFFAVHISKPLSLDGVRDRDPVIEDPYNYLGDASALLDTMYEIRDKTGMIPVVIALDNSEWKPYGQNLVDYAYDLYVSMYRDEKHIMIVYSYADDGSRFGDWYWESMYGDDTDGILYESKSDAFAEDLTDELIACNTPAEAINNTWQKYLPGFIGIHIEPVRLIPVAFMLIWYLVLYFISIATAKQHAKEFEGYSRITNPVIENNIPKEDKCDYCGGLYVISNVFQCPHCGAQLPKHDCFGNRIS